MNVEISRWSPDVDGRGGAAETEVSSGARRVEAAAVVAEPGDGSTPGGSVAFRLALTSSSVSSPPTRVKLRAAAPSAANALGKRVAKEIMILEPP